MALAQAWPAAAPSALPPIAPVVARGAAAAVLRPAAPVVPGPARAGQRRLPHAGGAAPARRAGQRRCAQRSTRSSRATRRCARAFVAVDGEPRAAHRCPGAAFALARARSRARPPTHETQLAQRSREEAADALRPGAGPLIRGRLLRLAPRRARPALHPCTTSSPTAGRSACSSRELGALYAAFAPGSDDPAAAAGDPVRRLRRLAARSGCRRAAAAQADYWREHLAGAPALLELPTDRPRPRQQDYARRLPRRRLDAELTARPQGAQPAPRHDAVHDAAGRLGRGARAPVRPGRHRHRHARWPTAAGARSSR